MTAAELANHYRAYIVCLNAQAWPALGDFVHEHVVHNGRQLGLPGYRDMLIGDFAAIPDLRFNIGLLVASPPHVACRLDFDCTPKGEFLGLPVNGRRIAFGENVFYEFRDRRIAEVWSVIDKLAIEAQLGRM
ncbi:ester cyclase [Bradyrhizobium sp. USDA 4353]